MSEDTTAWFDQVYRDAAGDATRVPWAAEAVCPVVAAYLAGHPGPGRAVVVGCGLGDDAEAVAGAGYETVAFDASPEAISWCRRRFPASEVDYRVADLFDPPEGWRESFDLVVEIRTVQSLPPDRQADVLDGVAALVAPGGSLLLVALARAEPVIPYGPPWAVAESQLSRLAAAGLEEVSLRVEAAGIWADFVGVYQRPPAEPA